MSAQERLQATARDGGSVDAAGALIDHLDLWTGAVTKKSSSGRGSNGKVELTGVKKLRELVLELAVRGKLVGQCQEDEPSSELLKKIVAERTRRIESGEIKKPKQPPAIDESELPFQIPNSWKFVRLGEAVDIIRGITFPASEKSRSPAAGRLACLRTTNVQDTIEVHDLLYIKESFVTKNSQHIQKNDIVMSMANSRELVGKVAFVEEQPDEPMTFGGFLGVLRPTLIHPKFLMAVLRAPHSRKALIGNASQTTNIANISIGKLNPLVIGLPPIEEQHRIVQKVDELMALCDRLEQQTSDQLDAHETLVDTLLGTLTQSENATELADNWARLAAHFDTLFTTEQSIDKLKQTILQLAVMGRLVRQDAGDEPASTLLGKLERERARLITEGVFKKSKKIPSVNIEEVPFEIPESWEWVRLSQIAFIRGGKRVSNGYKLTKEVTPYIYIRVSDFKNGSIDDSDLHYIDQEMREKISQYIITSDDIYMTIVGATIGKCGLVPSKFNNMNLTENAARITPVMKDTKEFMYTCLTSDFCQGQFLDKTNQVGVQKMALSRLGSSYVPLPPIKEQHRIVQKVDELMALCDQLKERLNQASTTRCKLAEAVVEGALS